MLKKRLIPKILIKTIKSDFVMVTTKKFLKHNIVGDPTSQAKIFQSQFADELVVVFIDKKIKLNTLKVKDLLFKMSSETLMPLTIGGGINSLNDIRFLMNNGADKVLINTLCYKNSSIIKKASEIFGRQCIVASVDYKEKNKKTYIKIKNKFILVNLDEYISKIEKIGVGEILLTNIDRDGTEEGLDLECAKKYSKQLNVPLIISGGCGLAKHFQDCFLNSKVEGIASGTFFSNKDQNPLQTRAQIKNSGVDIRVNE